MIFARHPYRLAIMALSLASVSPALAATSETQGWINESAVAKVDDNDSVTIDLSQRLRPEGDQFLHRITLDHAIARGIQLGGGFAYIDSDSQKEMRFHQQLTLSHGILQSRTRVEQRFIDSSSDPSWRLRERVQATLPLDKAHGWSLVGSAEFFFDLHKPKAVEDTELVSSRLLIGVHYALAKNLDAQVGYTLQQTFHDDKPDEMAHIPWITLNWKI